MLIYLLAAQAAVTIEPADLTDTAKVASLCRSATEASEVSGNPEDWLQMIDEAAMDAKLSVENQAVLLRMCVMYSYGVRDTAQKDIDRIAKDLDENTRKAKEPLAN